MESEELVQALLNGHKADLESKDWGLLFQNIFKRLEEIEKWKDY